MTLKSFKWLQLSLMVLAIAVLMTLTVAADDPTPEPPTQEPSATSIPPSETPVPTNTDAPSETSVPTLTPPPTATPIEIIPTNTLQPTFTLVAPSETPTEAHIPVIPSFPWISSPNSYETLSTLRPTIIWQDAENATVYEVKLHDADTSLEYGPYEVIGTTIFTVPENLPQHLFIFSVRAGNADGWSEWSSVEFYLVLGETPVYDDLLATTRPTFTWSAVDGATSYTLQVAADPQFDAPVFEVTTSNTSYALSIAERLPYTNSTYYWRLSTSNVDFPPSAYARLFGVNAAVPAPPVITHPQQGDYRLLTTLRPTITWDPVADATQYEVTFIDVYGLPVAPPVVVTDTEYTPPFNLEQTLMEVQVKSGNDDGWSDWSSASAGIGLGDAPEMDSVVTNRNPTFEWETVEGATSYTIQIDDNIEFNPPLIEFTTTDTSHTLSLAESLPVAGIPYYWRVSASNVEYPNSSFNHGFLLDAPTFPAPVITSPLPDAVTGTIYPTITWEPVPGATRYQVTTTYDNGSLQGQYHEVVGATEFTIPENLMQNYTTFSVRAGNDDGWGEWGSVNVFVMLGSTPLYASTIDTTMPTFSWPTVNEATSYTLQIDDDISFDMPLVEHTTAGTSYTLTDDDALPSPNARYYWRLSAQDAVHPAYGLAYPPYGYVFYFDVDVPPTAQPVITSPTEYSLTGTVRPTITWEAVADATRYRVTLVDYDGGGTEYGPYEVIGATQFTVPENLPQHLFGFSVRAGNASVWGEPAIVNAYVMLGSTPLYDTTIETTMPTFSWPVVDGATSYTLQVDDDIEFTTPLVEHTTTGTSYTLTAAEALPNPNARYYWRMSASNLAYPPYGYDFYFDVNAIAPVQPVITSPIESELIGTLRPTITWEAVADATRYSVSLTDNDTGTEYGPYEVVGATEFTLSENLPQHPFSFSVRAGNASAWGEPSSIYAIVMLGSTPLHASTVETVWPTFTWAAVEGATSYTLQVSYTFDFEHIFIEHTLTGTSYTFTGAEELPNPNARYYWRVAASNVDYPPYGLSLYFDASVNVPATPSITSPLEDEMIRTLRPTITWEAVADATRYQIKLVAFLEGNIEYGPYEVVGATEFTVPENLPQYQFIFSVRAGNANGWGGVSFTNANVMLGSTPLYSSTIETTRPTFTWTAVDGATSYTLQVDETYEFEDPLIERTITGTSYTLTSAEMLSNPNARYYWRLSASNVDYPSYGNVSYFDVSVPAPAQPVITSPTAFSLTGSVRPTITWDAVADATRYRVILYDLDNDFAEYGPYEVVGATQITIPENLPQHLFGFRVWAGNEEVWGEPANVDAYVMLGSTPLYESTIETTRPTFSWPSVVGATSYTLQVDDTIDFDTLLVERTVTGTSYALTEAEALPFPNGRYYWRLSASNVAYPPYGYDFFFDVNVPVPAQPVITSPLPDETIGTVRPTITWDAVAGATAYEVMAVDALTNIEVAPYQTVTTTQYTFPYNLPQGAMSISVRAKNGTVLGEPSYLGLRIVLGNTPAYESIVTTTRPTLKWTAVTGATNYTLQIDNDADFSSPFVQRTLNGTSYTLAAGEALPTPVIRYYWRVAASNVSFPDAWLARTFINGVTAAPTNLWTSREGETTWATLFGVTGIQFRWGVPAPVPYGYEVQYSLTSDFSSVFFNTITTEPSLIVWGADLPESKIYWRVRTIYNMDFINIGKWSSSRSFTVDLTAPLTPVVKTPAAGVIHTVRPSFSWFSAAGASSYTLSLYENATGTLVEGFPKIVSGTSYTIPSGAIPLNQEGYTWQVSATDSVGNQSAGSTGVSFTIFSGLTPTPGQTVTDTTPRFSWQSVSGTGAAQWRLEIGTSAEMTTLVYASANLSASSTSFTLPNANALAAGTYYWRVYRITEDTSMIPGQSMTIVIP